MIKRGGEKEQKIDRTDIEKKIERGREKKLK